MRIEKTETVELLDWEKENGLEIIVRYNYEEDNKYRRWVADLYNCKIRELTNTYLALFTDCEIKEYSSSLNSVLSLISDRIRGRHIYYNGHKIVCPNNLVHTKLVEPEQHTSSFKETVLGKLNTKTGEWTNLNPNIQPAIDAEGWKGVSNYLYTSQKYFFHDKDCDCTIYLNIENDLKLELKICPGNIITISNLDLFKHKANFKKGDDLNTKYFKIANYICSRLCDKIEK